MKTLPLLDNWTWTFGGRLSGVVTNHPRYEDGAEIRTEGVLSSPSEVQEGKVVETRDDLFLLGNWGG